MSKERDLDIYNEYLKNKTQYYYINSNIITEALDVVEDVDIRAKLLYELDIEEKKTLYSDRPMIKLRNLVSFSHILAEHKNNLEEAKIQIENIFLELDNYKRETYPQSFICILNHIEGNLYKRIVGAMQTIVWEIDFVDLINTINKVYGYIEAIKYLERLEEYTPMTPYVKIELIKLYKITRDKEKEEKCIKRLESIAYSKEQINCFGIVNINDKIKGALEDIAKTYKNKYENEIDNKKREEYKIYLDEINEYL